MTNNIDVRFGHKSIETNNSFKCGLCGERFKTKDCVYFFLNIRVNGAKRKRFYICNGCKEDLKDPIYFDDRSNYFEV